jgi:uncharacterized protein
MQSKKLKEKYGPWALIAGGSQGIGEAYARILGGQDINLVLLARGKPLLDKLAKELEDELKISVRTISVDLADESAINKVREITDNIEVNMLIYNAAAEVLGPFFNSELTQHLTMLDVNCRSVLIFVEHFGRLMKERKKGGIILMSSMSCLVGSPYITHYGATKAYIRNLAEGLWYELKPFNIDVISCIAGKTKTPRYIDSNPDDNKGLFAGDAREPILVAKEAIKRIGRDPSFTPGVLNKLATFILRRFISNKKGIKVGGKTLDNMFHYSDEVH